MNKTEVKLKGGPHDTSPLGKKPGGPRRLTDFEREVAHALIRAGRPEGTAIAIARSRIAAWASGRGNVTAKTRAKAAASMAQRAAIDGKHVARSAARSGKKELATLDEFGTETTGGGMEHKNVGVNGFKVLSDDEGVVEAIVSVTGIKDEVKDIIVPGAYAKTLANRLPKGVYSHSWDQPISKTLDVKELMPGDPALPKTLPNGQPWPKDAGALKVKTQFNLETQRGREAYSDVKFYGTEQEWSIGYNVPVGGAKMDVKAGVREISTIDLFEYSPVLFGAMPLATTQSVKSAQEAFKSLQGNAASWANQQAQEGKSDEVPVEMAPNPTQEVVSEDPVVTQDSAVADVTEDDDITVETHTDTDDDALDAEIEQELALLDEDEDLSALDEYVSVEAEPVSGKALWGPEDMDLAVKAMHALNDLLGAVTGYKVANQVPGNDAQSSGDGKNPASISTAVKDLLGGNSDLLDAAQALDEVLATGDMDKIDGPANDLLDLIESEMDESTGASNDDLTSLAKMVADAIDAATKGKTPNPQSQEKSLQQPQDDDETIDLSFLNDLRAALED